jgi:hypothetical protein
MEMVRPTFEGAGSYVHDRDAGIGIELISAQDFGNTLIFHDAQRGTQFSLSATVLARNPQGHLTWHLRHDTRRCGYEVKGQVGKGMARPNLSLEDIRTYILEGLRIIASDEMRIPRDQVVLEVALAP